MTLRPALLTLVAILSMNPLAAIAAIAAPPVAPQRPATDDYHGAKVADPYRYMEDLADPAVQTWIKAQADFAAAALRAIPGRDRLLARVRELDQGAPYRLWVVRRWPNGDLHYMKSLAAENLDKLYFRDAKTGTERLLIDPEKLADPATGKHVSLQFCRPSPDARYVAYGLAAAGSEQTVLRVLDVAAGKDLPDVIDRMEAEYTPPFWLPDSKSFVYARRHKLAPDASPTEGYKRSRAYLHRLGADPDADPVLFAMGASKAVAMSDTDFPSLVLPTGARHVIGKVKHGDASEVSLYAAPLEALARPAAEIPWQTVCTAADQVCDFALHGDDVYLLTAAGAPRYKVVKTSLVRPDFAAATTVVPEGDAVLKDIDAARDALYLAVLDAGLNAVVRLPFAADAKPARIPLPPGDAVGYPGSATPDVDGILLSTESWTRRGQLYAYDPATGALTDTNLRPRGRFDDVPGYESTRVLIPSHDGVNVPLTILHKAGLKLDGSHPTLVSGYGGYGHVTSVHYNPTRLAWLERGGVIAFAHVRGGGEFGQAWHHAGQKATKPNTWKDFIACAQYLVDKGYTSPARLAGQGGSAGGILIGRALTARPDLFAAAIISVGCTDMLRMETTTNGVPNIAEFGSTKTREGFDTLLEMSSYHQVKDGTKYPAVLLVHGINDPRVEPWMSAKMTARLQAATASAKPVLFRVDYDAGHGIGSTKSQRQELLADEWAFLLWQMDQTPAAAAPIPRTLTIDAAAHDLRPVRPRVGFLGGLRDQTPDDLLKPLHPALWRIGHQFRGRIAAGLPGAIDRVESLGAAYKLVISDLVRLQPGDWDRYEADVKKLVAQVGPARAKTIIWEPVNEPDVGMKPIERYYELYAHAFKALRAAAPDAQLCGPGFAFPNYDKYKAFLDYCRDHKLECNYLAWHYTGWDPNAPEQGKWQLGRMRQFIADYPDQKIREIHCDEWGAGPDKPGRLHPGRALVWFHYLENVYQVDRACRANWGKADDYLGGIVTQTSDPYPVYHAYRWYGQTAGQSRLPVDGNNKTLACLASKNPAGRIELLVGSIDKATISLTLDLRNAPPDAPVAVQLIPATDLDTPLKADALPAAFNVRVDKQPTGLRVVLERVSENEAYRIIVGK